MKTLLLFIFSNLIINAMAQNMNEIPKEQLKFAKEFGYKMGKSFFSDEDRPPLSKKVDPSYQLPWEKNQEISEEVLKEALESITQSLSSELDDFFDEKYVSIVSEFSTSEAESKIHANLYFEILDYSLKDENGTEIRLASDEPRKTNISNATSSIDGVVTKTTEYKHQFKLETAPDKVTGTLHVNAGLLSGYQKILLSHDQVGKTFEFNKNIYKLILFKEDRVLLEVIDDQNEASEFEYVCTNEEGKVYIEEFSGLDMVGGNSKVQIPKPTYEFFRDNPEGEFKAFDTYFDNHFSEYFSESEDGNYSYIGITCIGAIKQLYLYTQKKGGKKEVILHIE